MSLLNFRTRDYSKIALQLPVFSFIPFLFYLVKGDSTARQCCHVTFSVHLRGVIGNFCQQVAGVLVYYVLL